MMPGSFKSAEQTPTTLHFAYGGVIATCKLIQHWYVCGFDVIQRVVSYKYGPW
jgi:hypothetical protein